MQRWNSRSLRPEGLVEAAAKDLEGFKGFKVLRVWRLANGRLERPNNRGLCAGKGHANAGTAKGWRPEGLVEAAARNLEGFKSFKSFKRLKPGKRQDWMPQQQRAMCRQRAGCNPGTAKADGQRAWWQLPRGIWRVLRVLRVWSLANSRLERPNSRGYVHQTAGCNAGTAEATARGLGFGGF